MLMLFRRGDDLRLIAVDRKTQTRFHKESLAFGQLFNNQ